MNVRGTGSHPCPVLFSNFENLHRIPHPHLPSLFSPPLSPAPLNPPWRRKSSKQRPAPSAFWGEGALRSSAAELTRLALELAADDVGVRGVPRDNLKAAADALSQAGSAGRSEAVLALLDATTKLDDALGADLELLRGRASLLALRCGELLQAAENIEEVQRAAVMREDQAVREVQRSGGSRWWMLLRGWLPRRPNNENLEAALLVNHQDALIAVEFLSKKAAKRECLLEVVKMAREIQQIADYLNLPHHDLDPDKAAAVADNASAAFVAAFIELGTAAAELERKATAQLHALRAPLVQLADACREHGEAAKAMEAVQLAADERARLREAAAGTAQNERPQVPGPVQGDQRGADMQSYALSGWFSLVPYLAASTGELPKKISADDRWKINLALSSWVTVVSMSILFSSFARSWFWNLLATITSRVGLCGANVFAILFVYWILQIDAPGLLHFFLGTSVFVHFVFLIPACRRSFFS